VRVSSLLKEESILIAAPGFDKAALLETMIARMCAQRGVRDYKPFLAKILEREKGISTTLDTGLSLPHARVEELSDILAGLVLLPQGLDDAQQPELKIRVIFLFFSPNKSEFFATHLQILRAVSSLFAPSVIERLTEAATPAQALEMIRALD